MKQKKSASAGGKKIEDIIEQELREVLAEIDIQGQIDKLTDPGKIKETIKREIDRVVFEKVSKRIEMAIVKAIQRNGVLLDEYVFRKVEEILKKIDEVTSPQKMG